MLKMTCIIIYFLSLTLFADALGSEEENIKLDSIEDFAVIKKKLKIVIPSFKQSGTLEEILLALKAASQKHDLSKKGLAIIYRVPVGYTTVDGADEDDPFADDEDEAAPEAELLKNRQYHFDFTHMPVGEIIRYICMISDMAYKVDTHAVIVATPGSGSCGLITRFYEVDAKIIGGVPSWGARQDL